MGKVIDAKKGVDVTPEKYTQNLKFLGEAFALYLNGMVLTKVAAALKPQWPGCTARAVQRLAKEHEWEAAKNSFYIAQQQAIASKEGLIPNLILQMQKMRMQMDARVLRSDEVFAYLKLCDDLLKLTGKHPDQAKDGSFVVSTEKEMDALLSAIQNDEVVGPAFRKRKKEIQKKYEQNLKAGGDK